jgi:predicted PurR-regulated permease PerM
VNRESLRYAPSLILAGAVLLGAILLVLLFMHLAELLAVIFLGVVIGVALSPLTDFLSKYRVPPAVSVLLVYGTILGLISLFLWYALPQIAEEGTEFIENLEQLQERYEGWADDTALPPIENLSEYLEGALGGIAGTITQQAFLVVTMLLYIFTIFIVGLFYTFTKDSIRELFLSLLAVHHRKRAAEVLDVMGMKLRRYMLGQFIAMLVIGILTYIGLTIIGMPFALVLATIAFLFEILPLVGPWIAFIPAFLVSTTQGIGVMIAVAVLYLVLQQIESYIVTPVVQRSQTKMPAMLILSAILIGAALLGIIGALAALPLALILHTLALEVVIPWRQRQTGWAAEQEARKREEEREDEEDLEESPEDPPGVSRVRRLFQNRS